MSLLLVHVVATSAWLGLIAGESVMELHARSPEARRLVARIHRWIDICFEGPLIATVLVTGGTLLYRLWPNVSPLLLVKAAAGLVAIGANAICIQWVFARVRAPSDQSALSYTRKIAATGYAIPFAAAALGLGLYGV